MENEKKKRTPAENFKRLLNEEISLDDYLNLPEDEIMAGDPGLEDPY